MLDEDNAKNCGGQLLTALRALQARHGWSAGDLLAVSTVAFTELVAQTVGPSATGAFFRDHGQELQKEHERRALT